MEAKHFHINDKGRDFFVGDLHGCYEQFMKALAFVDFDFDVDRVFSVGDLIDRGEDSIKCLSLLTKPWFHCVIGNHEELMLGSHGQQVWYMNGGSWADSLDTEQLRALQQLIVVSCHQTMTVETKRGRVGVVHAESEDDWEANTLASKERNTWARTKISRHNNMPVKNIDLVVVGHTPVEKVTRLGNVLYIDTGAVFDGGTLTFSSVDGLFDGEW